MVATRDGRKKTWGVMFLFAQFSECYPGGVMSSDINRIKQKTRLEHRRHCADSFTFGSVLNIKIQFCF